MLFRLLFCYNNHNSRTRTDYYSRGGVKINFGNWDEELHKDPEQLKRICTMQRIKPENVTIFPEEERAQIIGTDGVYDVTLNTCTCVDFFMRRQPCKHIYKLASELGYLEDLPKPNRKAAKAFKESIPSEIEHFKEAYFNGAISIEKFNKIVNALNSK